MAKPLLVESSSSPGPSKLTVYASKASAQLQVPLGRRLRRQSRPPLSKAAPSSTLLSLLAGLASSSSVHGSPAPPTFLCPTLESGDIADCAISKRALTPQPPKSSLHPVKIRNTQIVPRHVPDRYRKQDDGVWRRVGSYTLYGSTMPACSSSSCATATPTIKSPLDDQIQVGDNEDITTTTTTAPDIQTDLPPGWKPLEKHSRTEFILLTSLFLALFIGAFIVGCMFWRRRVKKARRKFRDVEAKAKKKRNRSDDAEVLVEKEIKAKQKLWARATARWRSNARYTARQRRGRRISSRLSHSNHSSISLDNAGSFVESSSIPPSKPSSPRSSTVSLGEQLTGETVPVPIVPSDEEEDSTPIATTPTEPIARVSPPAYYHHGQIPSIMISPGATSTPEFSGLSTPSGINRSRRPSHSSVYTSMDDASQTPLPASIHAAHVATDDKALLARLAELASAPPEDEAQNASSSSLQMSAPEWHDEDLEEIAPHLLAPSQTEFSFSPLFPPPPSKQRLAAAEFYDYSYAFEEMATPGLEIGPSAPPFEEGSSPPQEGLVPSAPPLFEDDVYLQGAQPSAPSWDTSTQSEHESGQASTSEQDHEPEPSEDNSLSLATRGPSSATSPTRDSIVLPGYQP